MTTLQAIKIKETGKSESANGNHAKADNPEKLTVVSPFVQKTRLADVCSAISKSNDIGGNDPTLKSEIVSFIDEFWRKEVNDIEKPAVVISKARALYQTHSVDLKRIESINEGIGAIDKILDGMLLTIEKKLLRKKGKQWIEHYNQTYGQKSLRSAQDYMGLAGIDNILVYAPVGKERLLEIRRAIKPLGIEGDDPIGTFLKNFDIPFNPENSKGDESIEDLKFGIDYAVAATKIVVAEGENEVQLDVDLDLVKRLIGLGLKVSNSLINDLFVIKSEDEDVNLYLEGLCNPERSDVDILSPIKKVAKLPSFVAGIKVAVAQILQDLSLVNRINKDDVDELEEYVQRLKGLIENRADAK